MLFKLKQVLLYTILVLGQLSVANAADPVRGSLTKHKLATDIKHYRLDLTIDIQTKSLAGCVTTKFQAINAIDSVHIDLNSRWIVDTVLLNGQQATFSRKGHTIMVATNKSIKSGQTASWKVRYHGHPAVAKNAPWDGVFSFSKDSLGRDWVGVSCEGEGASSWWPCEDHPSDESDQGVTICTTYDSSLFCVSNGRLISDKRDGSLRTTAWAVTSPINLYNVTVNLAHYAYFHDSYEGVKGVLDLDYYVLDYNLERAKQYFKQTHKMLKVFEDAFGPYPYYKDGFKLAETPYWGMEHQSCIAYGNNYKLNKFGFDFILVHESGHEWWGNQLSCSDHADLWIHEGFCTYAELIYLERDSKPEIVEEYAKRWLKNSKYQSVLVGQPNVAYNDWLDSDIYYRGAGIIHGMRLLINDDVVFKKLMKGFAMLTTKPISTADAIAYWTRQSSKLTNKLTGKALNEWLTYNLHNLELPTLTLSNGKLGQQIAKWDKLTSCGLPVIRNGNRTVLRPDKSGLLLLQKGDELNLSTLPVKVIKRN